MSRARDGRRRIEEERGEISSRHVLLLLLTLIIGQNVTDTVSNYDMEKVLYRATQSFVFLLIATIVAKDA